MRDAVVAAVCIYRDRHGIAVESDADRDNFYADSEAHRHTDRYIDGERDDGSIRNALTTVHLRSDSIDLYSDGPVTFFGTRGLLDLRGGGPAETASDDTEHGAPQADIPPRAPGPPTLGGGVLAWLNDDEDHAQWEAAELQRRVTELTILAGPPRPTRVIFGERNGLEVVVCSRCCADVEKRTNNWARCPCGGLCCIRCAAMHCVRCGGDNTVPLSLEAALGSSQDEGPHA